MSESLRNDGRIRVPRRPGASGRRTGSRRPSATTTSSAATPRSATSCRAMSPRPRARRARACPAADRLMAADRRRRPLGRPGAGAVRRRPGLSVRPERDGRATSCRVAALDVHPRGSLWAWRSIRMLRA
jgi:hypothetical protein